MHFPSRCSGPLLAGSPSAVTCREAVPFPGMFCNAAESKAWKNKAMHCLGRERCHFLPCTEREVQWLKSSVVVAAQRKTWLCSPAAPTFLPLFNVNERPSVCANGSCVKIHKSPLELTLQQKQAPSKENAQQARAKTNETVQEPQCAGNGNFYGAHHNSTQSLEDRKHEVHWGRLLSRWE